jgi:hypothetical protein
MSSLLLSIFIPFIISLMSFIILKRYMWISFFINISVLGILLSRDIFQYAPSNESIEETIRVFFANDWKMIIPFYLSILSFDLKSQNRCYHKD